MKMLVVLLLLGVVGGGMGARILGVVHMPSRSHAILSERLLAELGSRGHQVTYIAALPPSKPMKNVKVIEVPGIEEAMMKLFDDGDGSSKLQVGHKINPWLMLLMGSMMCEPLLKHIFEYPAVEELINSNEKFDLIFGEIMFNEAILAGLSYKFKAPVVAFATFMPNTYANYLVGNPAPAAFIPDSFLGYGSRMTFFERVHNFLYGFASEMIHSLYNLPLHDKVVRKYFGSDAPYVGEILRNTSLVLVNHHHSLGFPRPYNPNMIEVAGVHINPPKELPKELKSFMDNSKNGVVLFSLGSIAKSSEMPPELIAGILKGLAKLDQDVLWKFEAELTDLPKNVRIMKWLPQSDILAHPNLKAFITHGGLLSTTEAMSRGVPVVGIPMMGDQHVNMKLTEDAGWGKTLQFEDLNENSIYESVREVVNDPKYKQIALAKSELLNDNPLPPLETAVWWMEYVIRHKGAPHLRSGAQDLAWYQYYLLDVYALSLAILLPILAINICITKAIFKKLFCSNKSKKQNEKKNK